MRQSFPLLATWATCQLLPAGPRVLVRLHIWRLVGLTRGRKGVRLAPCYFSQVLEWAGWGWGWGGGVRVRILAGVHPADNDMTRLNSWEPEWKDELSPRRYWLGPRSQEVQPRRRRFLMLHSRAQELCESPGGRPGLPSLISLRFLWT